MPKSTYADLARMMVGGRDIMEYGAAVVGAFVRAGRVKGLFTAYAGEPISDTSPIKVHPSNVIVSVDMGLSFECQVRLIHIEYEASDGHDLYMFAYCNDLMPDEIEAQMIIDRLRKLKSKLKSK